MAQILRNTDVEFRRKQDTRRNVRKQIIGLTSYLMEGKQAHRATYCIINIAIH